MKMTPLAALCLVLSSQALANETAAFLKLGVGARALGMAGAYTAVADDVSAIAWNPAGLSGLTKRELGATHAELTADTRFDFAGYAHPTKHGTFTGAMTYLSHGAISGRDANGTPTGGYTAADQAVNFSFASRFASRYKLGVNVKYIRSSIADASAQSYALDLGGQYALTGIKGPGVPLLGLAVLNMGPGMRFLDQTSQLPLTIAAGVGYRLPVGLTLAMDYKQRPHSQDSEVNVGTEYAFLSNFALRVGYSRAAGSQSLPTDRGGSASSQLSGMAMGLGLKFSAFSLDYSFAPMGELGNVQRFSLGARF